VFERRQNMNKLMKICSVLAFLSLSVCTQAIALEPTELVAMADAAEQALNAHDLDTMMSYLVQDEITSPSLEGNLLGDPATRPILLCLPPSYETSPEKRYPTVYLLHGFTADHTLFTAAGPLGVDIENVVDELMASGQMGETIIVMANGVNSYGGSLYERSEVIGDYRDYIAKDLVGYIDGKYRTIADRSHRGIAGHSMGGYGALSLAMEYPDVFGAVAALSPALADVEVEPTWPDMIVVTYPLVKPLPIVGSSPDDRRNIWLSNFWVNVAYAMAAAWTPNMDNPPYYIDLPVQWPEKTIVQEVWEKWVESDLASQIERDGANLSNTPIFVDEGRGPTVSMEEVGGVDRLLVALYEQGISYTYDAFDGDHLSHLGYQLASALKFLYPHIASDDTP
jgi:enterochelin esterase-like enzyme